MDIIFAGGKFRAKSQFANIAKISSTRKIGVIQYYKLCICTMYGNVRSKQTNKQTNKRCMVAAETVSLFTVAARQSFGPDIGIVLTEKNMAWRCSEVNELICTGRKCTMAAMFFDIRCTFVNITNIGSNVFDISENISEQ